VYDLMLGADGNPLKELFKSDGLHMTVKGYQIWKAAIAPVLLK
jgi:lysophospholipase L1-like esterase